MQRSSLISMGQGFSGELSGYKRALDSTQMLLISGAPELPSRRRMNPSAHSRFERHAEVFWLAGTRCVSRSPAPSMTVVSIQGANDSCGGYSEVGEAMSRLQ